MLSQPFKVALFGVATKASSKAQRFPSTSSSFLLVNSRRLIPTISMSQLYSTAIKILPQLESKYEDILTPDSLSFLEKLHNNFEKERQHLLAQRVIRQKAIDDGEQLNFLESTKSVREGEWKIGKLPKPLEKRRVEITGPVDRKMVSINITIL